MSQEKIDLIKSLSTKRIQEQINYFNNKGEYGISAYIDLLRDKKYGQINLLNSFDAVFVGNTGFNSPMSGDDEQYIIDDIARNGFINIYEDTNKRAGLRDILQKTARKIYMGQNGGNSATLRAAYKDANKQLFGNYRTIDVGGPQNLIVPSAAGRYKYDLDNDVILNSIPMMIRDLAESGKTLSFTPLETHNSKEYTDYYEEIESMLREKRLSTVLKTDRGNLRFSPINDPDGNGWVGGLVHISNNGLKTVVGDLYADNEIVHNTEKELIEKFAAVDIYNMLESLDDNSIWGGNSPAYTWDDIKKYIPMKDGKYNKEEGVPEESVGKGNRKDFLGFNTFFRDPKQLEVDLVMTPLWIKYRNSGLTIQEAAEKELEGAANWWSVMRDNKWWDYQDPRSPEYRNKEISDEKFFLGRISD
jgi:hypothetical protein